MPIDSTRLHSCIRIAERDAKSGGTHEHGAVRSPSRVFNWARKLVTSVQALHGVSSKDSPTIVQVREALG